MTVYYIERRNATKNGNVLLPSKLGVVFPHRNFFPWGMGKNGEGKFFSHGEMGKNGESYFGFELTKNGTKSTLFEFRACFLATSFFRTNV